MYNAYVHEKEAAEEIPRLLLFCLRRFQDNFKKFEITC